MEDFVELSSLDYDDEQVIPELILWMSLTLKHPDIFLPRETTLDFERAEWKWQKEFLENTHNATRTLLSLKYFPSSQLPDVCGTCFLSYGITTAGRYRFNCPACFPKGTPEDDYLRAYQVSVSRFIRSRAVNARLTESILCQLIYKYYSPNGDRQWQLKLPTSLTNSLDP